jgi:hypothetical protein
MSLAGEHLRRHLTDAVVATLHAPNAPVLLGVASPPPGNGRSRLSEQQQHSVAVPMHGAGSGSLAERRRESARRNQRLDAQMHLDAAVRCGAPPSAPTSATARCVCLGWTVRPATTHPSAMPDTVSFSLSLSLFLPTRACVCVYSALLARVCGSEPRASSSNCTPRSKNAHPRRQGWQRTVRRRRGLGRGCGAPPVVQHPPSTRHPRPPPPPEECQSTPTMSCWPSPRHRCGRGAWRRRSGATASAMAAAAGVEGGGRGSPSHPRAAGHGPPRRREPGVSILNSAHIG